MAICAFLLFHRDVSLEIEEENTEARGYLCSCVFRCKISCFPFKCEQKFRESKSWFEQDGEFACFNTIMRLSLK